MNYFKEWLARMGFNQRQVTMGGNLIGMMGERSISATSSGDREATMTERLAMSAVAAGLEPWSPEYHKKLETIRGIMDMINERANSGPEKDEAA